MLHEGHEVGRPYAVYSNATRLPIIALLNASPTPDPSLVHEYLGMVGREHEHDKRIALLADLLMEGGETLLSKLREKGDVPSCRCDVVVDKIRAKDDPVFHVADLFAAIGRNVVWGSDLAGPLRELAEPYLNRAPWTPPHTAAVRGNVTVVHGISKTVTRRDLDLIVVPY